MSIRYRPEIDGLRAVAVAPIVLFHAGIGAIAGGFIGVDIFFVISGFLITSIILREEGEGRFSLATFYRRRAVRILPALFAMLLVVLAIGAVLLLPLELRKLSTSAFATAAFASNLWFFFKSTDYFSANAEAEPLLHTWSLGVEEQFYILYPIFLIFLLRRMGGRTASGIAVAAGLSLLLGAALLLLPYPGFLSAQQWETANFHLLPMRAWELLIGAFVALWSTQRSPSNGVLAWLGLALIAIGYAVIEPGPLFPVPAALLPCIGAALVIAYAPGTGVARLLALAPVRGLGAISYSLYLWHWPIITFYRLETGLTLDLVETVGLTLLSVAAATLSYFLIEQPFLRRYRDAPSARVLPVAGVTVVTMCALALAMVAGADRIRVLPPEIERIAAYQNYRQTPAMKAQYDKRCFVEDGRAAFDFATCVPMGGAVMMGDSHAANLWRAVGERSSRPVGQITAIGCRPLIGATGTEACTALYREAYAGALAERRVRKVILSARWREDELPLLGQTIRTLRGRGLEVIVLGPMIEYEGSTPALLARARLKGSEAISDFLHHDRRRVNGLVAQTVRSAGGQFVDLQAIQCPGGHCVTMMDGAPMQWDYGHVTLPAARWIAAQMPDLFG